MKFPLEVLDCPICGSQDIEVIAFGMEMMHEDPNDRSHAVCCEGCGASGPEISPRKAAVDAWNKRVATPGELHWKHNHASVVRKSRILIERLDMPVERVQAYRQIEALELQVATLTSQLEELREGHKERS